MGPRSVRQHGVRCVSNFVSTSGLCQCLSLPLCLETMSCEVDNRQPCQTCTSACCKSPIGPVSQNCTSLRSVSLHGSFGSDRFTIHGLWPNYCRGGYPHDCGSQCDCSYHADVIKQLLPEMRHAWVSYSQWGANAFWAHEFNKHGAA
jgi:Ribonuclease T2 family